MAEFCLECWGKMNGKELTEADMVVDHRTLDLCEGCGEYKPVIIRARGPVGRWLWELRHPDAKKK